MKCNFLILTGILSFTLFGCAFKKADEKSLSSTAYENNSSLDFRPAFASLEAQVVNLKSNQITTIDTSTINQIDANYYETSKSIFLNLKNSDLNKPIYLKYLIPTINFDQSSITLQAIRGREIKNVNYKLETIETDLNNNSIVISIINFQNDLSLNDNNSFTLELKIRTANEEATVKSTIIFNPTLHIEEENLDSTSNSMLNINQMIAIKKLTLSNPTNTVIDLQLARILNGAIYKYIFEEKNKFADCDNSKIFVPNTQESVFWNTKDNVNYKFKEDGKLFLFQKTELKDKTIFHEKYNSNNKFNAFILPKHSLELVIYYFNEKPFNPIFSSGSCGVIRTKDNTPNSCHIFESQGRKRGCSDWEEVYPYNESACMLGEPIRDRVGMTVGCYRCKQGFQHWKTSSYGSVTESAEVKGVGAEFISPFQPNMNENINFDSEITTHVLSGENHPEWNESSYIPEECNLQKHYKMHQR